MQRPKIICTIGPGSNNPDTLRTLRDRGIDFFRINLSHTDEEDIEKRIKDLIGYGVPVILDTEGNQVRSGNTSEIDFEEGKIVKLYSNFYENFTQCDSENMFLRPMGVVAKLSEGDLISIDFNSVLLRVYNADTLNKGYIECKVVIGGKAGGKKAVQISSQSFNLPPFSRKDHKAMELAKRYNIKHFTLSFMENPASVVSFRKANPDVKLYSKIESKKGLDNFIEIAKVSDGILIDRGDLSSQVPLEKIPFIQKYILNKVRQLGKEAFVATNTLEQMSAALKPSKAEVNDIINTFLDGATGIALTKETAVGKYPVETVNMLSLLIKQLEFLGDGEVIKKIEEKRYIESYDVPELLIKPHGGKLVNLFEKNYSGDIPLKNIEVDFETLMDIEQIGIGAFSPLQGFMNSENFNSVVNNMRLSNGTVWTIPILLDIDETTHSKIKEGEKISLKYCGETYALLEIEEIYSINKEDNAKKIFGTLDLAHPGVKKFLNMKDYLVGGKITLLKRRESKHKVHELTPEQTRKIFAERGWSKVLGFHTRNVPHRSHEYIQIEGLRRGFCDGLFIHPVIGKKKVGDFEAEVIIDTYEKMINDIYPRSKVVLGTFATHSRYCGPREAVFTALVRKNFGCSHFIVGRDHTGVANFYGPNDSHMIFDNFSKEELGIVPIKFDRVFYSSLDNEHIHEPESIEHPEENKLHISGTQARKILEQGKFPPEWFMRPEISKIIVDKIKRGDDVFVKDELSQKILRLYGLQVYLVLGKVL